MVLGAADDILLGAVASVSTRLELIGNLMVDDAKIDISNFEEFTAIVVGLLRNIIAEDSSNVVALAFPTE